MVYTNKTDRSHPERRGFRTLPSFGEVTIWLTFHSAFTRPQSVPPFRVIAVQVRSFQDLHAHKWPIDPVLEYAMMTDYLAQTTDLGHPA